MPKTIVTVDRLGTSKVTTEGFTGEACIAASAGIEQALMAGGGKKVSDEKTPEFYETGEGGTVAGEQRW